MSRTDPTAEPLLTARGLHKSFGTTEVLRGFDLTLHRGEVVVLIGPSGSGKTTVLRALNGLETPDAGTIVMAGDRRSTSHRRCARNRARRSSSGWRCVTGRRWCSSTTTCSRT